MFNLVKKIVAGPKRTLKFEGRELDLTYISERIIAMAFPACNIIEKAYRNNINDVVQYLNSKHGENYLIVNVSNRLYDYDKFQNKVKDYQWNDHQAPPLTTLVLIGYEMYHFLKSNPQAVVAIHCNHGKGRTGTTIIAYMLLIGYMKQVQTCLQLYNEKRFSSGNYGVDQPCQLRYLKFLSILMKRPKIQPKIPFYRLKMVSQVGLNEKCRIRITRTRDQKVIMNNVQFNINLGLNQSANMLFGDCLIQIYEEKFFSEKNKLARINYNFCFIDNSLELTFSSTNIKLQKKNMKQFTVNLSFQFFCLCHLSTYEDTKCQCSTFRVAEEMFWNQMKLAIAECKKLKPSQIAKLVDWQSKQQEYLKQAQVKDKKYSHNDFVQIKQAKIRKKSASSEVRSTRQQKIYAQLQSCRKIYARTLQNQNDEQDNKRSAYEAIQNLEIKETSNKKSQNIFNF